VQRGVWQGSPGRAARVLVADDHAPTLEEIVGLLERDGLEVCAAVADAAAAVREAAAERPDACVLDVRMPGGGVAAAWEIAACLPEARVLMLTVSRDDLDLFSALASGACGYVLKDEALAALPSLVAAALRGESPLSPSVAARLVEELRDRSPRRRRVLNGGGDLRRLTSREWEIVDFLREGLSTRAIARRLVVAPATVRSHVRSIVAKVGAPDRRGVVEWLERQQG
jgi:DNA-binding NarL/FixJ family response regulator